MQTVVTNIHVRHDAREFLIFCFYRICERLRRYKHTKIYTHIHPQTHSKPRRRRRQRQRKIRTWTRWKMFAVRCANMNKDAVVCSTASVDMCAFILSLYTTLRHTEYWLCVWSHQIVMREENICFVYSVGGCMRRALSRSFVRWYTFSMLVRGVLCAPRAFLIFRVPCFNVIETVYIEQWPSHQLCARSRFIYRIIFGVSWI